MLFACSSLAHAGAWTLPQGANWFKVGFMYQDTTERYFLDGERIPYFFDGRNQTRALFFEYVRGLTDRWDVKVQLPIFAISFDDFAGERESNGLGDLRLESRYNILDDPMVLTLGGAIKFPTGEFVNDAEIVPVGEGQYDFDVFAEVGRSLWPVNAYVTGKIGYRFRSENKETNIGFGDEIIWRAEVGYRFNRRLSTKLLARGLRVRIDELRLEHRNPPARGGLHRARSSFRVHRDPGRGSERPRLRAGSELAGRPRFHRELCESILAAPSAGAVGVVSLTT